jgi:uncharacterized integral membrane protein
MSRFSRPRHAPAADPTPDNADPEDARRMDTPETVGDRVPRTRTGTAWVGVCVGAGIAIALLIFMAQNTRRVEISFLWMDTNTSLALTLLIAAVGGVLLTLIVGTARIVQLRRLVRRRHR